VQVGPVLLKGALHLRLVLAPKLSASMPSNADAMHVDSVHLDVALLLRLVRAVRLRALVPSNANIVHQGSVLLDAALLLRTPSSGQSCHSMSML